MYVFKSERENVCVCVCIYIYIYIYIYKKCKTSFGNKISAQMDVNKVVEELKRMITHDIIITVPIYSTTP